MNMKTQIIKSLGLIIALGFLTTNLFSQEKIYIYKGGNVVYERAITDIDSITFGNTPPVFNCGTSTITDREGNVYSTIQIDAQCWMKENLKCKTYDTQSERAGIVLSSSSSAVYTPYYKDGSQTTTDFSGNLTAAQRAKLGLLYNWAAAVGIEEGTSQETDFPTQRQGICPNGWHIPTVAEWAVLNNFIDFLGDYSESVGTMMKTTDAWFTGEGYIAGTNESGFTALPAGFANTSPDAFGVGKLAYFNTATINSVSNTYCMIRYLFHDDTKLWENVNFKRFGFSVRCLKND